MKKYTIKDKSGAKKIIYAKDLSHALTIVDNKVKDTIEDDALEGEYHTEYGDKLIVSKVNASTYSYFDVDTKHVIRVSINALKEDIKAKRLIKDSTKDEANLPTTIQALVNDEEAAIKAYEVAIKNLEGKIDETQMQVLINIMKDERRHVENLYAILNGKVTEKNLEDSIKDATLEITVKNQSEYSEIDSIAKKLHLSFYETTGNKAILEGSRKDLEEYIDLVWGGDASIKRQIRG